MVLMLNKILLFSFTSLLIILTVNASSTDEEIIKNLDFFQSMDMLKDEMVLVSNTPNLDHKPEIKKEEKKKSASEKNQ